MNKNIKIAIGVIVNILGLFFLIWILFGCQEKEIEETNYCNYTKKPIRTTNGQNLNQFEYVLQGCSTTPGRYSKPNETCTCYPKAGF